MNHHVETLTEADRGQIVRLTLEEGSQIEGRANQVDHVPDDSLRIELTGDTDGDRSRYQLVAHVTEGEWSPIEVRGFDPEDNAGGWTTLGNVGDVDLIDDHRMMDSEVDTGHEG